MFKANENVYSFITCTLWLTLAKLSARTCSAFTSFEIATDGAVTCLPMVSVANTLPSSPEKECCATFPKERMIAITAAALNRGIKRPVSVKRFRFFTTVGSTSARIRVSKSSPQSYFLLNLFDKQTGFL